MLGCRLQLYLMICACLALQETHGLLKLPLLEDLKVGKDNKLSKLFENLDEKKDLVLNKIGKFFDVLTEKKEKKNEEFEKLFDFLDLKKAKQADKKESPPAEESQLLPMLLKNKLTAADLPSGVADALKLDEKLLPLLLSKKQATDKLAPPPLPALPIKLILGLDLPPILESLLGSLDVGLPLGALLGDLPLGGELPLGGLPPSKLVIPGLPPYEDSDTQPIPLPCDVKDDGETKYFT